MTARDFIGIGIIGSGFARTTQIPGFLGCEGARIKAIASAHRENAERVAREFGIESVADDWREIVAREDVDLVSIVTPPATHREMSEAALAAGKAVLCEKPTAMNAGESGAMLAASRARAIHARVRGTLPSGVEYAADDPQLLAWVHCCLVASFLEVLTRGGVALSGAEQD